MHQAKKQKQRHIHIFRMIIIKSLWIQDVEQHLCIFGISWAHRQWLAYFRVSLNQSCFQGMICRPATNNSHSLIAAATFHAVESNTKNILLSISTNQPEKINEMYLFGFIFRCGDFFQLMTFFEWCKLICLFA